MNLSFSVREASLLKGTLLALTVAFFILLPVMYGFYYFHLGGREHEFQRRIEHYRQADPYADAARAIERQDYHLYRSYPELDQQLLHPVEIDDDTKILFGFRVIEIYPRHTTNPEHARANQQILTYIRTYNDQIIAHVLPPQP